jgi:hypothetical protein
MTLSGPHPDDFPAEEGWLDLTYPDVPADFVQRTWQRVQASAAEDGHDAIDDDPFDAALLAHYGPPEPSSGFVDAMLTRVRAEGEPSWRSVLAGQRVPDPSPDFVDRVLAALREEGDPATIRPPAPLLRFGPSRAAWVAAAAAFLGAIALFAWLPDRNRRHRPTVHQPVAAMRWSPDPVGTAFARLGDRRLDLSESPMVRLARFVGVEVSR